MKIYEPREDSLLLLRVLRRTSLSGLDVLDMGAGSGILAFECARQRSKVTAVDIAEEAVASLRASAEEKGLKVKSFRSDLFSNISDRYDLIIFNPPYLPNDAVIRDTTVDGGHRGRETIERFLQSMPDHVKKEGRCLLLLSSLNNPQKMILKFPRLSFRELDSEKLFYETLTVFEVKTNQIETNITPTSDARRIEAGQTTCQLDVTSTAF